MSYLRPGRRVRIQWERGGTWQDRILLCECQSSECEAELELTPSKAEILGRRVLYALSPDLDVYPHILLETQLVGFVALTNDGTPISESGCGKRWRAASAAYGADWEPTALEVCEALEAVRPGCLSLQGDEKPSRRLGGKVSSRSTPPAAAATSVVEELYPGLLVGAGALPDVSGHSWFALSADDASQLRQAVRSRDFDGYLIVDKVGIATKGTECLLVKAVDPAAPGPEFESDARVLGVGARADGSRHRHFTEAALQVTTTEWPEWPIMGARTASWCLEFLARQDQYPRARHAEWVRECRLEAADEGVGDHGLAKRMAELGLSFDQLNLGELASFELLMRKAQMAEWRHRDRLAAVQGDDLMEESYLNLGTGETRGLVMVAPALVDHINQEMRREAQILKGRRKAKGEREGPGGWPRGRPGPMTRPHGLAPRELLPLTGFAAARSADGPAGLSRSVRSRVRRRLHVANWIADAAESLNAMCGHGGARDHFSVSAGQQRSLEYAQSIIEQAGPPPCSPAAARAELRGRRPGCDAEPEHPAQCQREILSLPGPGARCDPSDVMCCLEHDQWVHWERHLSRRTPAPDCDIKLHNDRNLMADRRCYTQFILDLYTSGLIRVGAKRSAAVGVFCVWKSGRQRLRLIFDARRVNARSHEPDHSQLPSAAAWAALRTEPTSSLHMAQADVDNAFYRVKLPDKMDEHFSLPSVHLGTLRQLADEAGVDMGLPEARFGSPLLQVLPMGWSWSLYSCQRLLDTAVLRSEIDAGPLIKGLHAPLQVRTSSTQPGVCVDNVCIVGGDGDRCVADCSAVVGKPEEVGLKCKGVMEPEDLQTFTGITFERRPLPSIFPRTYVFARVAGRRRLRLWGRVELELPQAAALLVFALSDSKKPGGAFVCASDASRGQAGLEGGCGVAGQTWANELVGHTAASAEAWRFSVLGAIGARECALGFGPVEGTKVGRRRARAGSTSFEGVGRAAIRDFSDWGVLFHGSGFIARWAPALAPGVLRISEVRQTAPAVTEPCGGTLARSCGGATAAAARPRSRSPPAPAVLARPGSGALPVATPARSVGSRASSAGRAVAARTPAAPRLRVPKSSAMSSPRPPPARAEALRLAVVKACRSAHRGASERARAEWLTVLQSLKVGSASRVYFQTEYLYLDFLFWEGHNHHKGDKAFAALKHYNPGLGLSSAAALARATAGLRGFRKLARVSTRAPVARGLLFAAVGIALRRGWRSFAVALALSWGAMVRLPSELVQMTRATLVAPAPRSGRAAWGLLLFPEELNEVSKTLGCDEGVVLSDEMSAALGPELAGLSRARAGRQPPWDFDATGFNSKFAAVFDQLGHQ
ncbi:unnamed protein product, partial [Prorocentrum cordatum]